MVEEKEGEVRPSAAPDGTVPFAAGGEIGVKPSALSTAAPSGPVRSRTKARP